jgi:hypothetical protein
MSDLFFVFFRNIKEMPSKLTKEFIAKELAKEGCTLIGEYAGARQRLAYTHEGLKFNTNWNNWSSTNQQRPHETISINEKRFMQFLTDNGIDYEPQWTYDDLRGKKHGLLRFDFYLPDRELLVEIDDLNHTYNPMCIEHDNLKENYVNEHGLKLLRIGDDFKANDDLLDKLNQ